MMLDTVQAIVALAGSGLLVVLLLRICYWCTRKPKKYEILNNE